MFYLKEIYLRFQYIFFSFFVCLIINYFYKSSLLYLMTLNLQSYLINKTNSLGIDHLIYTHPAELFSVQISIVFYFTFMIIFPYLCWQILDFLRPGLIDYEHKNLILIISFMLSIIIVVNIICFFNLFSKFWLFFENFNNSTSLGQPLKYFFELKINEYFNFVIDFIYIVNTFLIIFFILFFLTYLYGIKRLIYWKKLFIFLNIVFATLLSPPDVYTQLLLFFILSIFIECILIILLYCTKVNKYF